MRAAFWSMYTSPESGVSLEAAEGGDHRGGEPWKTVRMTQDIVVGDSLTWDRDGRFVLVEPVV